MDVADLRDNYTRKNCNAHAALLEDIVENTQKHPSLHAAKDILKQPIVLAEMAFAGYVAGYAVSSGDHSIATQFAEYSAVLYAGYKLGIELPLMHFVKKAQKGIEEKIIAEKTKAETLRKNGEFHKYAPELGLDFKNNPQNLSKVKNAIQNGYCATLEAAKNPLARTFGKAFSVGLGWYMTSLILDFENNVIDWFAPNPIEKGVEFAHQALLYAQAHFPVLKDYLSFSVHKHIGDFNQFQILCTGMACGAYVAVKDCVVGNYHRFNALLRMPLEK